MAADRRVVCLDSDTGLFDAADLRDSGRYVNLGIAEHTLMAVAAGLAACGKLPFVNTMATFASTRAATHGGLAAGHLGPTHHALEDLAIMRVLPSMTVMVPADAAAVEAAVRQTMALPGPLYLRLGRDPTPPLCGAAAPPVIGRAQRLRPGDDLTIVACGPYPVLAALRASEVLASAGVGAAVLNMHTLKPLDVAALLAAASHSAALITVEEHWRLGGLGAAVAEALAELAPIRIARIGMSNVFVDAPGGQRDLLERYGIDHRAVVTRALALLSQSRDTSGRRATPVDTPPAATSMEVP
jgi:transketolase